MYEPFAFPGVAPRTTSRDERHPRAGAGLDMRLIGAGREIAVAEGSVFGSAQEHVHCAELLHRLTASLLARLLLDAILGCGGPIRSRHS